MAKEKVKPLPGTKFSIVSGCPLVRVKEVKFGISSRSGKSVKLSRKLETSKIRDFQNFVLWGTFNVQPCVSPSVTFCYLNILKIHCWNFIKPCRHIPICKTNTFNKKRYG